MLLSLFVAACATQRPPAANGPCPSNDGVRELARRVALLETWLSDYPPRLRDDTQRADVRAQWNHAGALAEAMIPTNRDDACFLNVLGDLNRQGHNLGVKDSFPAADQAFARCLAIDPGSVGCRFSRARLYIASDPSLAAAAAEDLKHVKELLAPQVYPNIELWLARAYFMQGQSDAALRQLDVYLSLRPSDSTARQFRDAIASGEATVVRRPPGATP